MFKKRKFRKISNDFIKKDQLIETWLLVEQNIFKDISVAYNNSRQVLELLLSNVQLRISGVYDNSLKLFDMMDDYKVVKFINSNDIVRRMHSIRKNTNEGSHSGLKDRRSLNKADSENVYVDLCIVLNYILLLLNDIKVPIVFDVNKLPTVVDFKTFFTKITGKKKKSRNFQNKYDYTRRNQPNQNNNRKSNTKNTNKKNNNNTNRNNNNNKQQTNNQQPKEKVQKPITKEFSRKYVYEDVMVFGGSSNLNEVKLHLAEFFNQFKPSNDESNKLDDFNRNLQATLDKNKYSTTLVYEKYNYNVELSNTKYVASVRIMGQKGADLSLKIELKG